MKALIGTYHFAGADIATWFGFAKRIFKEAGSFGVAGPKLAAITSTEYPRLAPRPVYSVLDTKKIERTFDIRPRSLRDILVECLKKLSERL